MVTADPELQLMCEHVVGLGGDIQPAFTTLLHSGSCVPDFTDSRRTCTSAWHGLRAAPLKDSTLRNVRWVELPPTGNVTP